MACSSARARGFTDSMDAPVFMGAASTAVATMGAGFTDAGSFASAAGAVAVFAAEDTRTKDSNTMAFVGANSMAEASSAVTMDSTIVVATAAGSLAAADGTAGMAHTANAMRFGI